VLFAILICEMYNASCLSEIKFSPPSRRGRREEVFLFGAEIPPNKNPSVLSGKVLDR